MPVAGNSELCDVNLGTSKTRVVCERPSLKCK